MSVVYAQALSEMMPANVRRMGDIMPVRILKVSVNNGQVQDDGSLESSSSQLGKKRWTNIVSSKISDQRRHHGQRASWLLTGNL